MRLADGSLSDLTLALNEAIDELSAPVAHADGTLASATSQLNDLLVWYGSPLPPADGTLASATSTYNDFVRDVMATLTNDDFTEIKKIIRNDPTARSTFKVWGLSKAEYKAMFQAAEDWFVNGFDATPTSSFKAALEVEAGTMTNAQAKQVGFAWMGWRFRNNP